MKKFVSVLLVALSAIVVLTACSTKSSKKSESSTASSSHVFEPKDTSNASIRKIETYGDYIIMAKKIYDEGYGDYDERATKLFANDLVKDLKETYDSFKADAERVLVTEAEDKYGDRKNEEITREDKDKLVKTLIGQRKSAEITRESLADQEKIMEEHNSSK